MLRQSQGNRAVVQRQEKQHRLEEVKDENRVV